MRTVIIGGVAGGASAAARLRRLDEKMEIIIIEKSGFISYANCGLPYYIGGIITDRSQLTLQTPESFWKRFRIEARVSEEVLSIDRERKEISIRKLKNGSEYKEHYDTLILSPGAEAIVPALPGIGSEKVLTLRHTEDSFRIREEAIRHKGGRAVVIGGGFIGLETAENLVHAGLNVTLIQRSDHVMKPFDSDMAAFLHKNLCLPLWHIKHDCAIHNCYKIYPQPRLFLFLSYFQYLNNLSHLQSDFPVEFFH